MAWYYYIALAAILIRLLLLMLDYRNYRYALAKYKRPRSWHALRVALIVPCKGIDSEFHKNITSLFNQDYENYLLWFVVGDKQDPAYDELCKLKDRQSKTSKAHDIQIMVAGSVRRETRDPRFRGDRLAPAKAGGRETSTACSQKIHNLLYCYERIGDDIVVLAFADSDICVRSDWLNQLVWPLRQDKIGASSGYRWFIPEKNNLASLVLSAVNGTIAQLLGNTRLNEAWGGSMAIRVDNFRRLGLDKIWPKTLSDDLSLSQAVKKADMKVQFVPACLAASHESTTWRGLFEFGRRQFLITRVYSFGTWLLGLTGSLFSVLGLWGGAALAIYAKVVGWDSPNQGFIGGLKPTLLFTTVFIVFLAVLFIKAVTRQNMISKLFKYENRLLSIEYRALRAAMVIDILAFWLWPLLLLIFIISSTFGRTICWRGIRYKLISPTETVVIGD